MRIDAQKTRNDLNWGAECAVSCGPCALPNGEHWIDARLWRARQWRKWTIRINILRINAWKVVGKRNGWPGRADPDSLVGDESGRPPEPFVQHPLNSSDLHIFDLPQRERSTTHAIATGSAGCSCPSSSERDVRSSTRASLVHTHGSAPLHPARVRCP